MSRTVTLSSLETQVRQRADMVGSSFITDVGELDEYVNQSVARLYDQIVQADEDYYTTGVSLTLVAGTQTYSIASIASDFYKLRGVSIYFDPQRIVTLDRLAWQERNDYTNVWVGEVSGMPRKFIVLGGTISFTPIPGSNYTAIFNYIPVPPRLTANGSITFDGNAGWEEFVVLDAAIKCLFKEESFEAVDRLIAEREALLARIIAHYRRDFSGPKKIARRRWRQANQFFPWNR